MKYVMTHMRVPKMSYCLGSCMDISSFLLTEELPLVPMLEVMEAVPFLGLLGGSE
jgi:hypothetical protein